jgi:hypothetical protein
MPQKEEGATARSVAKIQQATNHTPLPQKAPFQKRPAIKFIVCFAKLMHNLGIMPVVKHFKYLKL